jgi:hypothetical protein
MKTLTYVVRSPRGGPAIGVDFGAPSKERYPFAGALDRRTDYDGVFRVVRNSVRKVLKLERTGLGLGLANLPPGLGAFWQLTGNMIVLNDGCVRVMRAVTKSNLEFNSFIYVMLLHEYLHSLGYIGEERNRAVTAWVTRKCFGPDHPASRMADGDLWEMYPVLRFAPTGDGQRVRVVPKFDMAATSAYIR